MDLITIYEKNFTIFIGVFVTLAVMGTTTLYDRYKSKGGASFDLKEFKLFSGIGSKKTAIGSEGFKPFSEFSKKFSSLIKNNFGSSQNKSSSIQSNSSENFLVQVKTKVLKAKDALQKLFVNSQKSDNWKPDLKMSGTDKVNTLDKVVESKKDELDFDDGLLSKMSTSNTLTGSSPELKAALPSPVEMFSDLDMSFDNDFKLDESEFAIKVDGLDNEPAENNFEFNENVTEVKFGDESDDLIDSLKKDIVVTREEKINFMDNMKGENLDLKLMKSDLEGVLNNLNKYRHFTNHN